MNITEILIFAALRMLAERENVLSWTRDLRAVRLAAEAANFAAKT
ncbi:hypothetical protein [Paenibacillus sp. S150]|nr:hypothetical protein [Paenibacillus sp. S150]